MTDTPQLPLVIEPQTLLDLQGDHSIRIIDLSSQQQYAQAHIPGALFLDYAQLVSSQPPFNGLLPDSEQFSRTLGSLGIGPQTHVLAYDEEGGGKAARLIWTLHAMGHQRASLLNGGLIAWYRENHPLSNEAVEPAGDLHSPPYRVDFNRQPVVADTEYILAHLDNPRTALLDARSPEEYLGQTRYAQRSGRIPGAQHFEWTRGMNPAANYRLQEKDKLLEELAALGLGPDREIIVYCQSHHRSALSYLMLKYLGYERVRGYPGSWSVWGNRMDTPID